MTVLELYNYLDNLIKTKPEAKNFTLVYSSDDEGNSFHEVHNLPSLVKVNDLDNHYIEDIEFFEEGFIPESVNALIIN